MADITGDLQSIAAGMSDYSSDQTLLDYARGVGAEFIGQPFSVYRVGLTSSGDVIQDANRIATNFPMRRGPAKKLFLETGKGPVIWQDVLADVSGLLVGDIFIETDPAYGPGADSVAFPTNLFVGLALVQHPVLNRVVGARLDRSVKVYRQQTEAGADGYLNQTFDGAKPLQCTAGSFALGTPGQPAAAIPAGFGMERRATGSTVSNLEDQVAQTRWSIYCPPLKGFTFREADFIVTSEGDRYRVINGFFQMSGATGSQLLCQREVSQTAP